MDDFRILILGLGKVAIGYDLDNPNGFIKSHLFAIHKYAELNVVQIKVFCIEPNPVARMRALNIFPELFIVADIKHLPTREFDVVVNAVPIEYLHENTARIVENINFGHLVIEKPGVSSLREALEFNSHFKSQSNVHIAYPRRTLTSTEFLKLNLCQFKKEELRISIKYSGRRINILPHFLDLLEASLPQTVYDELTFLDLEIENTAESNRDDHVIHFTNSENLDVRYENGGKFISTSYSRSHGFEEELISQIKFSSWEYLDTALGKKSSRFPHEIASIIIESMEV